MSETVRRWQKRSIDLRNQAAVTTDSTARHNLEQLAYAWEAMANARQRIIDLGGSVPEEMPELSADAGTDRRLVKWGNPATGKPKVQEKPQTKGLLPNLKE